MSLVIAYILWGAILGVCAAGLVVLVLAAVDHVRRSLHRGDESAWLDRARDVTGRLQ